MSSSTRLLAKLEESKQKKDFYQAHQICRTIYVRLRSTTDDENILKFLFESACYFLEHNQSNSGYDLCKSYIEILNRSKFTELTDTLVQQICRLYQLLRAFPDERIEFTCNVLRWSTQIPCEQQSDEHLPALRTESNASFSSSILSTLTESNQPTNKQSIYHKSGHPKLHEAFARILWEQEKNYKDSRYHYLRSFDGRSFAAMLIEAHQTLGYPSEIDLFIAQTVLQYLLLRNFHTAYLVFVTYVEQHPKIRQPPPGPFDQVYPMLNFLWFLLLCFKKILVKTPTNTNNNTASGEPNHHHFGKLVESNFSIIDLGFYLDSLPSSESVRCFSSLVDAYKPSLERDSTLVQYIERLGSLFFGVKQKKTGTSSSNPLENLMQSLTAGFSRGMQQPPQHHLHADAELDFD